jgi:S1-C subfamily serine protease
VNLRGELIGINTAIASPTGSYSGYSFAIPANLVRKVTGDLMEFGSVQRALLGVVVRDVDAALAAETGLKKIEGVYVQEVNPGSAAAVAGIRKGDVILKINGKTLNSVPELQEEVGRFRPGNKIKALVRRGDKEQELQLTLKDVSGSTAVSKSSRFKSSELGAEFSPASPASLKKAGLSYGLKIESLGEGVLADAGLEEGYILYRLDKKAFRSPEEFLKIYKDGKGGLLLEALNPEGERQYLVLVKPGTR